MQLTVFRSDIANGPALALHQASDPTRPATLSLVDQAQQKPNGSVIGKRINK